MQPRGAIIQFWAGRGFSGHRGTNPIDSSHVKRNNINGVGKFDIAVRNLFKSGGAISTMSDTPQGSPRREPYEYHGAPEGRGEPVGQKANYAEAARGEIWHVHAKRGETVYVNRDDSRQVEMHVENGGRVIPVGEQDFLRRGGRIGRDGYGRPYPPFVWESHPDVPRYDESRGASRLPRDNRNPQVHIHVEIGDNGRGRIYRTGGDWDDFGRGRRFPSGGCDNDGYGRPRRFPSGYPDDTDGYGRPRRFPTGHPDDNDGWGRPRYPRYPQDTDGYGRPRRHDDDCPPYFPQRRRGGRSGGGVEVGVVFGNEDVRIGGRVRIPVRTR